MSTLVVLVVICFVIIGWAINTLSEFMRSKAIELADTKYELLKRIIDLEEANEYLQARVSALDSPTETYDETN